MAQLKDILAYTLSGYRHHAESNARVTKTIYLADWKHAIDHGRQISDIQWFYDNYGPFVHDVKETAQRFPSLFEVRPGQTIYGQPKTTILLKADYNPTLTAEQKKSIDHALEVTRHLSWDRFLHLVYSTFPIVNCEKYSNLDLVRLAKQYEKIKRRSDLAHQPT